MTSSLPFYESDLTPGPSLALGMSVSISIILCNSCINSLVYCWKIRAVRVRAINLLTRILPGWNTRKQIQKEEYSKYFVTRYLNKRTHCEALVLNNWKEKLLIEKCESARHLNKLHLVNQRLIAKYRVTMKFQHNAFKSRLKFSTVILPVLVEY